MAHNFDRTESNSAKDAGARSKHVSAIHNDAYDFDSWPCAAPQPEQPFAGNAAQPGDGLPRLTEAEQAVVNAFRGNRENALTKLGQWLRSELQSNPMADSVATMQRALDRLNPHIMRASGDYFHCWSADGKLYFGGVRNTDRPIEVPPPPRRPG